jgi:hypothetical protein
MYIFASPFVLSAQAGTLIATIQQGPENQLFIPLIFPTPPCLG